MTDLDLYQQVILEHNRKPRNYHDMPGHTSSQEGYNPLCGDHLYIYAKVEGDTVTDVSFLGEGCAISKAAGSMMTMAIKGKTLKEAESLSDEFQRMIKGELDPDKDDHNLGRLKIFSGIWKFPTRVKCALLAWHALDGALADSHASGEGEGTAESGCGCCASSDSDANQT